MPHQVDHVMINQWPKKPAHNVRCKRYVLSISLNSLKPGQFAHGAVGSEKAEGENRGLILFLLPHAGEAF